jgi:hypothetical protein
MGEITPDFLNQFTYAVYTAMHRVIGERAWEVVWASGDVLFEELERELDIKETEPLAVLEKICRWFERNGYAERLECNLKEDGELEYDLYGPVIKPSALRLIREGAAPPHLSTALMFSALRKRCGLKAEMLGDPIVLEGGARERWRLSPIEP